MHNTPTQAIPIMIRQPSNLTPWFVMDIDKWGDGLSPIILRDMQAPLEWGDSLTRCQLGEPRSPHDLEHGCSYIYRINSINSLYASKGPYAVAWRRTG